MEKTLPTTKTTTTTTTTTTTKKTKVQLDERATKQSFIAADAFLVLF
jgi:hypothetical protein